MFQLFVITLLLNLHAHSVQKYLSLGIFLYFSEISVASCCIKFTYYVHLFLYPRRHKCHPERFWVNQILTSCNLAALSLDALNYIPLPGASFICCRSFKPLYQQQLLYSWRRSRSLLKKGKKLYIS